MSIKSKIENLANRVIKFFLLVSVFFIITFLIIGCTQQAYKIELDMVEAELRKRGLNENDSLIIAEENKYSILLSRIEDELARRKEIAYQDSLEVYKRNLEIKVLEKQLKKEDERDQSKNDSNIQSLQVISNSNDYIAVIDFVGYNVSETDCNALTERFRAELYNTGVFTIIERKLMNEILIEQGIQQSGCTDNDCVVQVGKLIGVKKIITGSVNQMGNIYSVSARVVNVESGIVERVIALDHRDGLEELLTDGMKKVASKIILANNIKP